MEEKIIALSSSLSKTAETYGSARELLESSRVLSNEKSPIDDEGISRLQESKKKFILDSFRVSKVQKEYKEWERRQTDSFVKNEITAYNKTISESARLNIKVDKLMRDYEILHGSVKLPSFTFSIETLKKFGNDEFLGNLQKDENGEYPSKIHLHQVFSADSKSSLPFPDFQVFYDLVNLEFRLRTEKRIKYEILVLIRNQIAVNNTKWTARDNHLSDFIGKRLYSEISEIEKIRVSEAQMKENESDESEYDPEDNIVQEIEEEEEHDEREQDEDEEEEEEEVEKNDHEELAQAESDENEPAVREEEGEYEAKEHEALEEDGEEEEEEEEKEKEDEEEPNEDIDISQDEEEPSVPIPQISSTRRSSRLRGNQKSEADSDDDMLIG
ncbi:predicted protein [Scheffersomyces stipitis CBS 6054]|uniref:Uncharacterized protein n=1 Tax=Scheffersomyces stipitis (strain ATCC 58785 / CBS 6054 / NBRC 10063 / NRRL Y-11545) TaxID=322104 RepID=A3LYW3_PICST|nr:predicted protein [Scheffersomyces stipitis CBS 6054]ABN68050.2 predicted protein [Scheffersomyces stipitis CBS 6054]